MENSQEFLQEWEKKNNPFYPNEMRWDRVKINQMLAQYEEQKVVLPLMSDNLIWQTRDEFPVTTNPLQKLNEIFAFTSRDCSEDKMIACMYGIITGWDDASYEELKQQHNWSDDDIKWQKLWHENYKKAWNAFMETSAK